MNKKCKNTVRSIANILETARKILKVSALDAAFRCSTRNDNWFWIFSKKNIV